MQSHTQYDPPPLEYTSLGDRRVRASVPFVLGHGCAYACVQHSRAMCAPTRYTRIGIAIASCISMHATVDARVRNHRRGDVVDDYAWWCGAMSTVMRVMMLMMVMVRAGVMAMLATVVTAIQ